MHTDPGGFGVDYNLCDADHWPNQINGYIGAIPFQPSCYCEPPYKWSGCSHYFAIYLWLTSINNTFIGTQINRPPTAAVVTQYFGFKYCGIAGEYGEMPKDKYPHTTCK